MATVGRRGLAAALLGVCAAASGFGACDPGETATTSQGAPSGTGPGEGGGTFLPPDDGGPPPLDAAGLCGNQLHQTVSDAPNVYFVIDASGSMGIYDGNKSRYAIVRGAAIDLVRELGALINVGAALFPRKASFDEPCSVGGEVMAVTPGDPYKGGEDGATTTKFKLATNVTPQGGTPTAPTLAKLRPGLKALPGKTFVVLVTDGGPNCNSELLCAGVDCQANIEGCSGDTCCNPGGNCCKPDAPAGPEGCLDRLASLNAVEAYAADGIPVYVVGIPGSEFYSELLEDMAIAAGTAQFGKPFYYAVDKLDNLGSVFGAIAAVAVSCIFNVEDPPETPDQTNVYLDGKVLPGDLENGWRWMDPDLTRIELLGDACDRLKNGEVKVVQIVSGCPTEPAK